MMETLLGGPFQTKPSQFRDTEGASDLRIVDNQNEEFRFKLPQINANDLEKNTMQSFYSAGSKNASKIPFKTSGRTTQVTKYSAQETI